jgi:hypothetical protein
MAGIWTLTGRPALADPLALGDAELDDVELGDAELDAVELGDALDFALADGLPVAEVSVGVPVAVGVGLLAPVTMPPPVCTTEAAPGVVTFTSVTGGVPSLKIDSFRGALSPAR